MNHNRDTTSTVVSVRLTQQQVDTLNRVRATYNLANLSETIRLLINMRIGDELAAAVHGLVE